MAQLEGESGDQQALALVLYGQGVVLRKLNRDAEAPCARVPGARVPGARVPEGGVGLAGVTVVPAHAED